MFFWKIGFLSFRDVWIGTWDVKKFVADGAKEKRERKYPNRRTKIFSFSSNDSKTKWFTETLAPAPAHIHKWCMACVCFDQCAPADAKSTISVSCHRIPHSAQRLPFNQTTRRVRSLTHVVPVDCGIVRVHQEPITAVVKGSFSLWNHNHQKSNMKWNGFHHLDNKKLERAREEERGGTSRNIPSGFFFACCFWLSVRFIRFSLWQLV